MFRSLRVLGLTLAVAALALTQQPTLLGQTVIGPAYTVPGIDKPIRVIQGRLSTTLTLTNDHYYVLRGAVFVAEGGVLNIQAGTTVAGELATLGTLIVERGGRLNAVGTAAQPIVMTSDQAIGNRNRGDWGGLIINGRAPLNVPGGIGIGEGDTGEYGGDDVNDNSGILRYVRVEFAGIEFSPDNELNGIAFQGVGRGTTVDYVQVKMNRDDGVEFFGGTVDIKHIVLNGIRDDSLDWTFGWSGRVQYLVAQQRGDDADMGIEADNNDINNNLLPRSNPTIYNMTLVGDPTTTFGNESNIGMILRRGTATTIRNAVVVGFKSWGIDINGSASLAEAQAGTLSVRNSIFFGNGTVRAGAQYSPASVPFMNDATIRNADPGLIDPFNLSAPNFRPTLGSLAGGQLAPATPPNDGFFEVTTFIGAFSPDPEQDWTRGWTDFALR
ncbi:hypothetical protein [Luteitalea sp.]